MWTFYCQFLKLLNLKNRRRDDVTWLQATIFMKDHRGECFGKISHPYRVRKVFKQSFSENTLNELSLKTKNHLQPPRPPFFTIATSKVDACFWKTHFGSFHAKLPGTRRFLAAFMKSVRNVVCFVAVWAWHFAWWLPGDTFHFALFSWFNNLKLGNTISMATKMVSFNIGFISFQLLFLTFYKGKKDLIMKLGFLVKNLKTMHCLKTLTMFPWKPKLRQETHFRTSFRKIFIDWIDQIRNYGPGTRDGHQVSTARLWRWPAAVL